MDAAPSGESAGFFKRGSQPAERTQYEIGKRRFNRRHDKAIDETERAILFRATRSVVFARRIAVRHGAVTDCETKAAACGTITFRHVTGRNHGPQDHREDNEPKCKRRRSKEARSHLSSCRLLPLMQFTQMVQAAPFDRRLRPLPQNAGAGGG